MLRISPDTSGAGGGLIRVIISFTIPNWLEFFLAGPVMLYHRLRHGYSFRRIPLTQGKYAIVDPDDFERLNKHKWHAVKSSNTYYAVRCVSFGRKQIYIRMHREVIHPPDHLLVDHINHNGLDNRKANLRLATRAQNNHNRLIIKRKDSSSKYKGVAWRKSKKKWRAQININGQCKFLGYFKDEIQAAKAYDKAAKKYHGEFASLNFPD